MLAPRHARRLFATCALVLVPAVAAAAPPVKPDKPVPTKPAAKPDAPKPDDTPASPATPAAPSTAVEDKCVSPASPEAIKDARARIERATALYNDLEYKLALIEFNRAYERAPNCRILYNIGQVNLQLSNWAAALQALQHYLDLAPPAEISKERRALVERDIASLKARTTHLTVNTNIAAAQISLDDSVLGNSPLKNVLVDSGQHRISVSKEGYQTATQSVTLASGEEKTVDLVLTPVPVAVGPGQQIIIREHEAQRPPANYLWVGWTITGVLAAGAITTGVLALTAKSDLTDKLKTQTTADDLSSTKSRARTLGIVSDVLLAGTVVAGGVSLYFTLKKPKSVPQQKGLNDVRLGMGLGSVEAVGTF